MAVAQRPELASTELPAQLGTGDTVRHSLHLRRAGTGQGRAALPLGRQHTQGIRLASAGHGAVWPLRTSPDRQLRAGGRLRRGCLHHHPAALAGRLRGRAPVRPGLVRADCCQPCQHPHRYRIAALLAADPACPADRRPDRNDSVLHRPGLTYPPRAGSRTPGPGQTDRPGTPPAYRADQAPGAAEADQRNPRRTRSGAYRDLTGHPESTLQRQPAPGRTEPS